LIVHVPARAATHDTAQAAVRCRDLTGIAATISDARTDWPGRRSTTVLLGGCDLRCPYCFAPEHVNRTRVDTSVARLVDHVGERASLLDGVVVSGGEPTVSPVLYPLVEALREIGLPVKLDTNGASPEVLAEIVADRLVSFVSLDVKTTPDRYDRLTRGDRVWQRVERSVALLSAGEVDHEFRTTCFPFAVSAADLPSIAAHLVGGRRYALQQFVARRTLDPAAATVTPTPVEELRRAAMRCSVHLPTVVRGV
jgi:pyruvate formate lyase activating enzyme